MSNRLSPSIAADGLPSVDQDVVFWVVRPTQEHLCRALIERLPDDVTVAIIRRTDRTNADGAWQDSAAAGQKTVQIVSTRSTDLSRLSSTLFLTPEAASRRLQPPKGAKTIHLPHSPVSLHAAYPHHAFTSFDGIIAAGPHHVDEFTALSRAHDRIISRSGYLGFSLLKRQLLDAVSVPSDPVTRRSVIVAPSWHRQNLLSTKAAALVRELLTRFDTVHLRPHYKSFESRDRAHIDEIQARYQHEPRFHLEQPGHNPTGLHTADVMVADYSGVAIEFAAVRRRPVVFADLPPKIRNRRIVAGLQEPIEWRIRAAIGAVVQNDPGIIAETAFQLAEPNEALSRRIDRVIDDNFFEQDGAADCAASAIANLL